MHSFRVTGRFVLFALLALFLVVVAANTVFIAAAVRSFPGEKEEKSYLQGLAYNRTLEARRRQAELGWTARIVNEQFGPAGASIDIAFATRGDAPISDLAVKATLSRTVDDREDREAIFELIAPGTYRAVLEDLAPGLWALSATATNTAGESLSLEKKLVLE